jgi:hypothetical protein
MYSIIEVYPKTYWLPWGKNPSAQACELKEVEVVYQQHVLCKIVIIVIQGKVPCN